ncbi:MAG: hypothetical protein NTZ97_05050 [Candidatus Moranbacteria bacterium]|nr:hypothetical protein [Candidatus Moranbacteria bacterium]
MKKIKLALIISLAIFIAGAFSASAQEESIKPKTCLDYYAPGDMGTSASIIPSNPMTGESVFSAGEKIKIKIFVNNLGKIKIPDGNILIRIEKRAGLVDRKMVSESFYPENIALNPEEVKWLDYEWIIPEKAESGKYIVSVFAMRGKNPNVEMYSFDYFEESAELNEYNFFTIKGQEEGAIVLDEKKTKINGSVYDGMGVDLKNANEIKVTQTLENLFAGRKTGTVEYKLYRGNYFSEDNVIDSKTETIGLEPKKSGEINYISNKEKIKDNSLFPYYLRTVINYDGINLISTVPIFNKENFNGAVPTLNYFTFLENFPIKKGENAKVLACINYSGKAENAKIEFILKDMNGAEVAKTEKEIGNQSNLTTPISFDFKAKKNYDQLSLETRIIQDNEVQDKYAVKYDSQNFGTSEGNAETATGISKNLKIIAIVIFILAIILIGLGIIIKRRKKNNYNEIPPSGTIMGIFLACLILSGIIFPNLAKAEPVPFEITQKGNGLTWDGTGAGLDCGLPFMAGLNKVIIPYQLGVDGTTSHNGTNLVMNSNSSLTFSLGREITRNTNGTPYNFMDDTWNVGKWAKKSAILNPYKYENARVSLKDGLQGISFVAGGGRTNFFSPAVGMGVTPHLAGGVIGAGLMEIDIYPQYFPKQDEDNIIQSDDDCGVFDFNECKKSCCDINGCTNAGCKKDFHTCTGGGNFFDTAFEKCVITCNDAKTACNNIAKNGKDFKDFFGNLKDLVNDISHPNSVKIESSDKSVLDCDPITAECRALKPGTVMVTVTLSPRIFIAAELPIVSWGYGTLGECKTPPNYIPNFGFGGTKQEPISFYVTVKPSDGCVKTKVQLNNGAGGVIQSDDGKINCRSTTEPTTESECFRYYSLPKNVPLTATADHPGSIFDGWGEGCDAVSPLDRAVCLQDAESNCRTVTAKFKKNLVTTPCICTSGYDVCSNGCISGSSFKSEKYIDIGDTEQMYFCKGGCTGGQDITAGIECTVHVHHGKYYRPSNYSHYIIRADWTSSKPSVVFVNYENVYGKIRGESSGTSEISAEIYNYISNQCQPWNPDRAKCTCIVNVNDSPPCGNGVVEPALGETCDPPNSVSACPSGGNKICQSNCQWGNCPPSPACTPDCGDESSHCEGLYADSCGNADACEGTMECGKWREVAP